MKRIFALTIILGIILCAVCAASFSAERTIGRFTTDDDNSFNRMVGDLPEETRPDPTEEIQIDETRVIETLTTDETIGEDETTVVATEAETEAETVAETTIEPTVVTDETETTATDDSAAPLDPNKPHRNAVKTGDNALLYVGIGLLIVAMAALLISMKKRANSYDK